MKKLVTILAILLLTISVQSKAQLQQGNVLVGGDIANFNLGLDKGGNFSFLINPKVPRFIRDNLAIGGYKRKLWSRCTCQVLPKAMSV
ncbi:MAG TPA: hypothetical protein VK644_02695 [Chitinophagaceae bacterium]|nr:hypothetical protein [Chitinophagaceae bacterium]